MKSLQYLNKYFFKYKWRFLFGILFTIISNYFGVQMPLYVKSTVDDLMGSTTISGYEDALFLSLKIGGIYILLSIGKGFFLFLMRQTIIVMSRFIEFDLKNEIYAHYQKLDLGFFKRNSTGDLMNRISEDVSQVRMYLGPGIMYTINLVVLSSMIIVQMVNISPQLTLFVLMPLPLMSFLIYRVSSKMNTMSRKVQEEQSNLSTISQETFSGIRVIKAYNRETEMGSKFEHAANEYKNKSMKLVLVNALFMPTIMFLIGVSTLIAIYMGGLMTYDKQISLGGIVAFIFFVNNLTWPFASLGWVTSIIQRAAASQKRISEFLETEPTIVNTNHSDFDFKGGVEFKNVNFTYDNTGIQALKNLSFKIKQGDTLAIIGKTGSGKSTTLAALIDHINTNQEVHIITVEDPVEFVHKNKKSLVNQREVGNNTLSFAAALKSALREDPDIILVGEMRDIETIHLALSAAETGHLVFGTLHTSSAAQTINRIIDVFPSEDKPVIRTMLSTSIKAVVSQRLIKKQGGGRCAVYEIMIANSSIRNLIREDKIPQINSIIELNKKSGMCLMKDSIVEMFNKGFITKEVMEESLTANE